MPCCIQSIYSEFFDIFVSKWQADGCHLMPTVYFLEDMMSQPSDVEKAPIGFCCCASSIPRWCLGCCWRGVACYFFDGGFVIRGIFVVERVRLFFVLTALEMSGECVRFFSVVLRMKMEKAFVLA